MSVKILLMHHQYWPYKTVMSIWLLAILRAASELAVACYESYSVILDIN